MRRLMEKICGARTLRGKTCLQPKSRCIYHQKSARRRRRKIGHNQIEIMYNPRGVRVCGVKTMGHSQRGRPCRHQLKEGQRYCVFHSYLENVPHGHNPNPRVPPKNVSEREKIAQIITELGTPRRIVLF